MNRLRLVDGAVVLIQRGTWRGTTGDRSGDVTGGTLVALLEIDHRDIGLAGHTTSVVATMHLQVTGYGEGTLGRAFEKDTVVIDVQLKQTGAIFVDLTVAIVVYAVAIFLYVYCTTGSTRIE